MQKKVGIFWHRRDLRIQAPKGCTHLVPLYISSLENLGGASNWWLAHALSDLQEQYEKRSNHLIVCEGDPTRILLRIAKQVQAETIYWNTIWEPPFFQRDEKIRRALEKAGLQVEISNENYLIDPRLLLVKEKRPYRVFTPFYKTALKDIHPTLQKRIPSEILPPKRLASKNRSHKESAWEKKIAHHWEPSRAAAVKLLKTFIANKASAYAKGRDIPSLAGTSRLSPYLHFGQLSIHEVWQAAHKQSAYLRELIWREFANYFVFHYPQTLQHNWNTSFDHFPWNSSRSDLKKWQRGKTGYPIVDAGMRQLWETGWMHNRARMIVASFLTKDLLIDWKEGEKWFWDTLVDADKPNNVLGWQWVAGCGPDAAPYFRIFNPVLQGEKFDPKGDYVRQYVPELKNLPDKWIHHPWEAPKEVLAQAGVILGKTYPVPIVDHKKARLRALKFWHDRKYYSF